MTQIFSTNRAIRSYYEQFIDEKRLLPKAYSISTFLNRALQGQSEQKPIGEELRTLLMRQACRFDSFEKLKIPHNFMAFVKNVNYLFSFFEELANEKKSIEQLRNCDTYLEFDEHLSILEQVQKNYVELLEKYNFCDKITSKSYMYIDEEFVKS